MSRRIEIVDTCEHGEMNDHKVGPPVYVNPINIQERPECPGGSRTVLDPEEWVEKASLALATDVWHEAKKGPKPITGYPDDQAVLTIAADGEVTGWDWTRAARAVLESVLGVGEKET